MYLLVNCNIYIIQICVLYYYLDFFTVFYCNCHQHKKLLLRIQPRKRNCPLGPSFFVIHHFFGSKYEKYIYNIRLVIGQMTNFGFLVLRTITEKDILKYFHKGPQIGREMETILFSKKFLQTHISLRFPKP